MTAPRLSFRLLAPAAALALVACGRPTDRVTAPDASALDARLHPSHTIIDEKTLTAVQRAWLGRLRQAVTRFDDANAMRAQGWDLVIPCRFKAGTGGQGVHYINRGMVGAGTIDPLRPNILMYETQKNGRRRLVGVEWGVPLTDGAPPEIHGLPFHANTRDGLWVLHIWVPTENPSGLFADWNPRVGCTYDQPADEIR